jgi:hypothetical protein
MAASVEYFLFETMFNCRFARSFLSGKVVQVRQSQTDEETDKCNPVFISRPPNMRIDPVRISIT